jgi:hypothetical protein
MPLDRNRRTSIALVALGVAAVLAALVPTSIWLTLFDQSDVADVVSASNFVRLISGIVGLVCLAAAFSVPARRLLSSKLAVFLAPVVGMVCFYVFKQAAGQENSLYLLAVKEDSSVEYLSAILLFAAVPVSLVAGRRAWGSGLKLAAAFHLGLAVFMLFMGLEEISYGQRIFGYDTPPEMAADNTQHEFNFHNLSSLKWLAEDTIPGMIVDWGLLGWAGILLARLLLARQRPWLRTAELVLPPWYLTTYFVPFALWANHSEMGLWDSAIWQDQEITEMVLALAFLAFSIDCLFRVKSLSTPEKTVERPAE